MGFLSKTAHKSPAHPNADKHTYNTPLGKSCVSHFTPNKYTTPSPGVKETLGDRFIPMRACANLCERFMAEEDTKCPSKLFKEDESAMGDVGETEPRSTETAASDAAYSALLKAHVLHDDPLNGGEGENAVRRALCFVSDPKLETVDESNCENEGGISSVLDSPVSRSIAAKPLLAFRVAQKCGAMAQQQAISASPLLMMAQAQNTSPGQLLTRKIPLTASRVLDAPGLQDDFYLNVVDWASNDILGVGLQNTLYTLTSSASNVTKLLDLPLSVEISSLAFNPLGTLLSVGLSLGTTYLMDPGVGKVVRMLGGHENKVTCTSWCDGNIFSTGSRDKRVLDHDIRAKEDCVLAHEGHGQEVCGLKWSFDQRYLATGGNDNRVLVWTPHTVGPLLRLTAHTAAVKALAWNPNQSAMLATGGGTADRCIKLWDIGTGRCIRSVETGAQICNLLFSRSTQELVSTHGYSHNSLVVWRYPGLARLATLSGHTRRVLYLSMSPDAQTVVTGAGDETLRFWPIFPSLTSPAGKDTARSTLFPSYQDLR
jgi:hypothetical protein